MIDLVAPIDLTATEIDNIGRVPRGVNAALAIKRLDAAAALVARSHDAHLDTQREMLRLANAAVGDAIRITNLTYQIGDGSAMF